MRGESEYLLTRTHTSTMAAASTLAPGSPGALFRVWQQPQQHSTFNALRMERWRDGGHITRGGGLHLQDGPRVRNTHKVRVWGGWAAQVVAEVLKADWCMVVKRSKLHLPYLSALVSAPNPRRRHGLRAGKRTARERHRPGRSRAISAVRSRTISAVRSRTISTVRSRDISAVRSRAISAAPGG